MRDERILELIEQKKYIDLKKELPEMNEVDISEIIEELDHATSLLVSVSYTHLDVYKRQGLRFGLC